MVKQSINSSVGMSSFLPVFNFSLYRTDTTSAKDTPYGLDHSFFSMNKF